MNATNSLRHQVLSGYRRLIRASRQAFNQDEFAIQKSMKELRSQFQENRLETDQTKILKLIKGIQEVEEFLLHNIVQGRMKENGNYKVKLKDPQKQIMQEKEELVHLDARNTKNEPTTCCQLVKDK